MGMKSWKNYCKASKRVSKNTPRKYKQKPKKKNNSPTTNSCNYKVIRHTAAAVSQSGRQPDIQIATTL